MSIERHAVAALLAVALAAGVPVGAAHAQVGVGAPPVTSVDGPTTIVPTSVATTTTLPGVVVAVGASSTTTVPVSGSVTAGTTTTLPTVVIDPGVTTSTSVVTGTTVPGATSTTLRPTTTVAGTTVASTPDQLRAAFTSALSSSTAATRSVEVSVDGLGTVVALDAEQGRAPASTQKIYVAATALLRLGASRRFVTEVRPSSPVDASGTVTGALVVRASGDPSFTSTNLATLADGVAKSGVKTVLGGLGLDDSIFDTRTRLEIWKPSFTPGEVGALSAFLVDGNHRSDKDTLLDPGLANLRRFRALLQARGIVVGAGERRMTLGDGGPVVASVQSAPLLDLVTHMMKKSDNTYAEVLTKHIGRLAGTGSTTIGVQAIASFFTSLGLTPPSQQVDGSGLSLLNRSSAHQQVQFVRKVLSSDAGASLLAALPIACVDGTLRGRFCGTSGASVVKAKTGTIDNVTGLTGVTQTASGRRVVFSILLNGTTSASRARAAIDRALVSVTSSLV